MTLWLDRLKELGGRPCAHALVIGVSQYHHLDSGLFGLKQAQTPAMSALAVAHWLRDDYHNPEAPLATIRLLLSPSPAEEEFVPELAAEPAPFGAPLRDEVEEALLAWAEDCRRHPDGVAILYASGHGVQRSKEDAIVLLADFARTKNALAFALDVGEVHRGLTGADVAQTQFYFVDACRVRPEEFVHFHTMGHPFGLPEGRGGEDRRCAPIWFSAAPGTAALGRKGTGTLFSQALLRCLDRLAAVSPSRLRDRWHVTTLSLSEALERAVSELTPSHGERQQIVTGGLLRPAVVHVFRDPPLIPVSVQLEPSAAGPHARADLWDCNHATRLWTGERFVADRLERQVPAGLYSLDLNMEPETAPFAAKSGLPLLVEPPETLHLVRMVP